MEAGETKLSFLNKWYEIFRRANIDWRMNSNNRFGKDWRSLPDQKLRIGFAAFLVCRRTSAVFMSLSLSLWIILGKMQSVLSFLMVYCFEGVPLKLATKMFIRKSKIPDKFGLKWPIKIVIPVFDSWDLSKRNEKTTEYPSITASFLPLIETKDIQKLHIIKYSLLMKWSCLRLQNTCN